MNFFDQLDHWGQNKVPFVFFIDFEMAQPEAYPINECPEHWKYDFQGITNHTYYPSEQKKLIAQVVPPKKSVYQTQFDQTKEAIQRGDTFLMNLTTHGRLTINRSLEEVFNEATAKYKILRQGGFACFSPETFIQIKEGVISTRPMKGTIDASEVDAEEKLQNNAKENAEHATVVDLLRNDLSLVAKQVRVNQYKYYEEIKAHRKTTGQLSSCIEGRLPDDYPKKIGQILQQLLPAGSISGAPKTKTIELIQHIEESPRRFYTGIAGIFDGRNLDSCVMIRFLHEDGTYRCGGGITHLSTIEEEYHELIQKIYVPIL
jgi:para-aminobenzoate synthetase component 1